MGVVMFDCRYGNNITWRLPISKCFTNILMHPMKPYVFSNRFNDQSKPVSIENSLEVFKLQCHKYTIQN